MIYIDREWGCGCTCVHVNISRCPYVWVCGCLCVAEQGRVVVGQMSWKAGLSRNVRELRFLYSQETTDPVSAGIR